MSFIFFPFFFSFKNWQKQERKKTEHYKVSKQAMNSPRGYEFFIKHAKRKLCMILFSNLNFPLQAVLIKNVLFYELDGALFFIAAGFSFNILAALKT